MNTTIFNQFLETPYYHPEWKLILLILASEATENDRKILINNKSIEKMSDLACMSISEFVTNLDELEEDGAITMNTTIDFMNDKLEGLLILE